MNKFISKKINLPLHKIEAFEYFTNRTKVSTWLCEAADIDVCVGGRYELYWDKHDRIYNNTVGCTIINLEYGKFIEFSWKGPKEFLFMNNSLPLTMVRVEFESTEDSTHVTLIHSGWHTGKKWEKAMAWFDKAWDNAFCSLKKASEQKISHRKRW